MNKIFLLFLFLIFIPISYGAIWESTVIDYSIGTASGVCLSDFDNDGDIDFGFSAQTGDKTGWCENDGALSFSCKNISSVNNPQDTVCGDLDGDGFNDIITSYGGNEIHFYKNRGNRSFLTYDLGNALGLPQDMEIIDIDSDGDNDITLSTLTNGLYYLENDGSESFTPVAVSVTFKGAHEISDIDSDGDYDIVSIDTTLDDVAWFENDGTGSGWTKHDIYTLLSNPLAVGVADLNNDGNDDIIVNSQGDTDTEVFLYVTDDSFTRILTDSSMSHFDYDIKLDDINGDGNIDYIAGNSATDTLHEYLGIGNGSFSKISVSFPYSGANNVARTRLGDIDQDGDIDHLSSNPDNHVIFYGLQGGTSAIQCNHPTIFCDNFNYVSPISTRDWTAYTGGFSVNTNYAPSGNKLKMIDTGFLAPFHETDDFTVNYPTQKGVTTVSSIYAPVISVEFELNVSSSTDNDESFSYSVNAHDGRRVLRFKTITRDKGNLSWYYWDNELDTLSYSPICENCSTENSTHDIKIIMRFKQSEFYQFNSSYSSNYIDMYIDDVLINSSIPFVDDESISAGQYQFLKNYDPKFTIDDYYVIVGTDKNANTSEFFYDEKYKEDDIDETIGDGLGTGDLAENVESIWDEFGIRSSASKIIVALVLLFISFGGIASIMASNGAQGSAIVIPAVAGTGVMMILLTFIKLLPLWIPILMTIFGVAIGSFFVVKSVNGG